MSEAVSPIQSKQRILILDVLRGIALLGICLANYPEFSLYSFLDSSVTDIMPTAGIDRIVRYFQYIFIDGKFYTLFSILFGIGFSIILSNAEQKGKNGLHIFYRRMAVLFLFGLFHLIFLWAGDILILYAFLGLFLPLFRNATNRSLLVGAGVLLALPIFIDALTELFGWNPAAPAINATTYFHSQFGITNETFPVWLVEKQSYIDVLKFNIAGSFIRMQEFIEGNRAFKVLGLFLLGLYIGRNKLYADIEKNKGLFKKVRFFGFLVGLPITLLYAFSAMNGHPWSLTVHSVLYSFSILPLSLAYATAICLWYIQQKQHKAFRIFATPGRMALTNYIMQSVFGIIIFYGIGFELGASVGLVYVEFIAIGVFIIQILYSHWWLHKFQFGILEWIWRMLTYKKWLKITK
ncbi:MULTISPECIES: DUF418 domain-containing protein [Chryseobacterium]|uniref:DUF418 domain-containing protein n=1 Tax=Chryseobacterium TaxID=59732 RepID=UPI0019595057|nr:MULTISPECIES: DUF418 domain-containing protein [Chryseobacterium]MBM7421325.1 uncharacterized protein [Chryseobacterium sp. JUb44]MDH6211286.1 uncharacterized protein [Chryseobacterium sp. BIGb0186]WSO09945.1 DUF418 domain-containing protein [Chryseobacterium scophthalmum]